MDNEKYQELGQCEIEGKSNFGENIRNEDAFDELKMEVNKTSSLDGDTLPDWRRVIALSEKILKEESKDLLVSAYLAFAKLETEGFNGLTEGLHTMLAMCEVHWESLYPPKARMAGRRSAITWLSNSLETYFSKHNEEAISHEDGSALRDILEKLDSILSGHDDEMSLFKNIRQLDGLNIESIPEPEAPAEEEAASEAQPEALTGALATPAPQAPAKPATVSFDKPIESGDKAKDVFATLRSGAVRLSDFWLSEDSHNPNAYIARRVFVWAGVEALPKQVDGVSFIEAPDEETVKNLQTLNKKKKYAELIAASEALLADFPFWLDLQYYTCRALEQLGKDYTATLEAVKWQIMAFLARFGACQTFYFLEGEMPFASQDTKTWLDELNIWAGQAVQKEQPQEAFEAALAELADTCESTRLEAAIKMQSYMNIDISEHQKLRLLIHTVDAFVVVGEKACLPGYVKQLGDKLAYFHVLEWDRELGKEALVALIKAKQLLGQAPTAELDQLAMIDIATTLSLKAPQPVAQAAEAPQPQQPTQQQAPQQPVQQQSVDDDYDDE